MKNIKIEDNFLEEKSFKVIYNFMVESFEINKPSIPWFFQTGVSSYDDKYFQFIHPFLADWRGQGHEPSEFLPTLNPIFDKIGVEQDDLVRVKANLLPKDSKIVQHDLHVDICDDCQFTGKSVSDIDIGVTTSIFYLNTNNGYTYFEDGTKVESIANRLVTFPSNTAHGGTTCTDKMTRVVLNINYRTTLQGTPHKTKPVIYKEIK